jgi:glycosyltransferase 2 family protein
MTKKLAVNLGLSLAMLGLCLWLVWPDENARRHLGDAIRGLEMASFWPYLAGYTALLAVTHFCRAWRWNNLLAPLGVRLPGGQLLAISSVGFMAILALPARLGEFVRPALLRQKGHLSASAALGTVAVERIVDGLMVSLFVFGAFFALRGPQAPGWMMPTAYAALFGFAVLFAFLVFAMKWPRETVRFSLKVSLISRLAPKIAAVLERKLLELIRGFDVLRDGKNLAAFVIWTLAYWIANGLSLWVLAKGFGMPLSLVGAFATMGLVAVGISLPNSPGLVGQYQWLAMLGLSLYLGPQYASDGTAEYGVALAFAIVLHMLQVIWYLVMGALGIASPHVSFADLRRARKLDEPAPATDHPA